MAGIANGAVEVIGNNHYVHKMEENQTTMFQKESLHVAGITHTDVTKDGMVKETKSSIAYSSMTKTSIDSTQQLLVSEEESTILSDIPLSGFYSRKHLDSIVNGTFIDKFKPCHQLGPDYLVPTTNIVASYPHEAVEIQLADSGFGSRQPMSIITALRKTVEEYSNEPALSVKINDEWNTITYQQYWDEIQIVANAFIKLGLKRFHAVSMLGFNAPQWFMSNFGVIFAGGFSTGIYTTNSPSACEHILKHSRTQIIVVENEQQLAKILKIRDNLPELKAIIQYNGTPSHEDVFSWNDLIKIGKSMPEEPLQKRIKNLAINQCCSLSYTSGTTGQPKAVMLSHDNLVIMMEAFDEKFNVKKTWPRPITVVSFLPLNHLAAQATDMYSTMSVGGHVYFAQPDALKGSLRNTLMEVKPYMMVSVPRLFEKFKEKVEETIIQMNSFKAALVRWSFRKGYQYTKSCVEGAPRKPLGYKLAKTVIYKIREHMGLDNSQFFVSGGAPISMELLEFFMGLDILLMECYGMSECAGPHIVNLVETYRPGSAGKLHDDFELKIADPDDSGNGEICIKGRNVYMGYMFDEKNTKNTVDSDRWLHSGDIGRFDSDNYLYITGRIKELIITAGGENVAPAPIEAAVLAELPIISQAMVVGDKRKYLSMLLTLKTVIDMDTYTPLDTLSDTSIQWCRSVGSNAKTVKDVISKPDMKVMTAIQEGINRANDKAESNVWRIRKWKIIPKEFSLERGEVSPTMKLKRHVILAKYKDIIDSIYA